MPVPPPTQVKVLPISERQQERANAVLEQLQAAGLRAAADLRSEKIGYRIREAQLEKTPYMLIIGDKEVESGMVSVRARKGEDLGAMSVEDFLARILEEIRTKAHD